MPKNMIRWSVAVAVLAGAAGAVGAAPASAATAKCTLSVTAGANDHYRVLNVDCTTRNGYDLPQSLEVWGSDPVSDDRRGSYYTTNSPIRLQVTKNVLNEDTPGGDEVYVKVKFITAFGDQYFVRSNEVHGSW